METDILGLNHKPIGNLFKAIINFILNQYRFEVEIYLWTNWNKTKITLSLVLNFFQDSSNVCRNGLDSSNVIFVNENGNHVIFVQFLCSVITSTPFFDFVDFSWVKTK